MCVSMPITDMYHSDTTESVFGSGKCEITYEPRIHSNPNVERYQEDDVTVHMDYILFILLYSYALPSIVENR